MHGPTCYVCSYTAYIHVAIVAGYVVKKQIYELVRIIILRINFTDHSDLYKEYNFFLMYTTSVISINSCSVS